MNARDPTRPRAGPCWATRATGEAAPRRRAPTQPGSEAGFTLIELIVALGLLALLMLIVPSTLRLAQRASITSATLISGADRDVTHEFLRRTLAEALPLVEPNAEGVLALAFSGDAQSLEFVAPLANGPAGGGLYRVRLLLETPDGGSGAGLAMQLRPLAPNSSSDGPQSLETRMLEAGLASGSFRYLGTPAGKRVPEWSETWTHGVRLPDMVELPLVPRGAGTADAPLRVELRLRKRE